MHKSNILALDVGRRRIGVAVAGSVARIAHPLTTLNNADGVAAQIADLAEAQNAGVVVVGLPRGLDGQTTAQSEYTAEFARQLQQKTGLDVHLQDEAVTSRQAEEELKKRGKPYRKSDIDALAATYILDDYLSGLPAA